MPVSPHFPLRIFYDGACVVCASEIAHYLQKDGSGRLLPIDISAVGFDPVPYGISIQAFQFELHAIDQQGTVYRGVDAFRAIWQAFPDSPLYRFLGTVVALPVISSLARVGYRGFARLRPYLPKHPATCTTGKCRPGR